MPMLHFDLDELFEDLIPEEKSKKQNSTDTEHKDKFSRNGREVPQAQQPQGFATLPNNSTESTNSTKCLEKHTLEEHLDDLTEEEIDDEAILIERMIRWVDGCRVGNEWKIPKSLLRKSHGLQRMADNCARNSRTGIRIWKIKKNYLTCCTWSRRFIEPSDSNISGVVETSNIN